MEGAVGFEEGADAIDDLAVFTYSSSGVGGID